MNHLREWQKSCVDEELTRLNVTGLDGSTPSEYLLYSDELPRRNDGRVSNQILKRYEHTEEGGWWCSGVDLLTGRDDLWGCFKPNFPRLTLDQRKLIKYEHPPKTPTGIFALRVPLPIWQRIADHFELEILPQDIDKSQADLGFWQWLVEHPQVPLCITEGAKKAGTLLTAGYAAIALPGINSGYRVPRDEFGDRIGKSYLIPQLQKLATSRREIYIAFDQDSKPTTIQAVNIAIKRMGYLLTQVGCSVKIITWNAKLGKGVDDLIATSGEKAFDEAYENALSLEIWKAQELTYLTYAANRQVNCRYLPDLDIPETAKLIAIKSPKGTGKTQFLEKIVAQALARKQWVLVIGHRIRLVEELCQRFGLNYITEIRDDLGEQVMGYGLCIDSLHPKSQAKFNASNWSDGIIIIDEVEQVLWHGLNSDTCKGNRVAILKSLKVLMQNALASEGKVFIADADLSDISLEYLISLSGIPLDPFIIQNDWQADAKDAWQVCHYPENDPNKLVRDLVNHIKDGGKPFICLSAQKLTSKWGTRTLESYLQKQFPQAKILRIDSESLAEPDNPAYNCMTNLNQVLVNYDIVLASPSIETGVSINLKGHFTSVWGIAQGVQTATSVCQALARIRDNIPRYIWLATYGFNQIGNGSTSISALLTSGHRWTQLNINLLQQSDFDALDDLDTGFQAESLLCWAKMAVRVNVSMLNYRNSILTALRQENHQVIDASLLAKSKTEKKPKNLQKLLQKRFEDNRVENQLSASINSIREENYQAECEAIANANDLTENQYLALKNRLVKTITERRAIKKYDLKRRYGIAITPQLITKDDEGWYQKLRLHYFLTIGRQYLADRDVMIARKLIAQGHGSLFLPDFNGSQLGAIIGTMEVLGISVLLANPQRKLRNTDADLQAMAGIAINNRLEIKTIVGIGIAKNASSITIIRRFLEQIGYGITCICTERIKQKQVRVYQVTPADDSREEVFQQWLLRDQKIPGSSECWLENYAYSLNKRKQIEDPDQGKYVQLKLDLNSGT